MALKTGLVPIVRKVGAIRVIGGIIPSERILSLLGARRDVAMRRILSDLSVDQKDRMAPKLEFLVEKNVNGRALQDAKSLKDLFGLANDQARELFEPSSVVFVRNLGPKLKLDATFSLSASASSLSLSKDTSPALFGIRHGYTVYVADTKKGPIILANRGDELFEVEKDDPGIKISKALSGRYKALLAVPIYLQGVDVPLGSVVMLWSGSDPIGRPNYVPDLMVARRFAGFIAPTLFDVVARSNMKDLPPGLPAR